MSEQDPIVHAERRAVDAVRTMFGVVGLVAIIVGILITINPIKAVDTVTTIIAVILALYMAGAGVVYFGSAIFATSLSGWARTGNILLGLLYVIAAIILFANLGAAGTVLQVFIAILIGIMWIVEGVLAFSSLKSAGNKFLTILYALLSIAAGVVMIFSWSLGMAVISLMIGISLIVLGAIQVVRAFTVKSVLS